MKIQGNKVIVSAAEVGRFNASWPCSELRETRAYWFEFDSRNFDLIDLDVPESDDGAAAKAMADDCQAFLFENQLPEWGVDERPLAEYRMTACRDGDLAVESFMAPCELEAQDMAAQWLRDRWNIEGDSYDDIAADLDGLALDLVPEDAKPLIELIAAHAGAMAETRDGWQDYHRESIAELCREHMPSGSGFDNGTQWEESESRPDKLVFSTGFHHMNEGGHYDGWTQHRVIVTPSFIGGFAIKVSGRDRRGIKDYIAQTFESMLSAKVRQADMQRPEYSEA